jgi:AcrR family transcriptional regulator
MTQSATRHRGRTNGRSPGRPRDAAIDGQVLQATLDLLVERGLEATTIQAVSDRTGIARATIYLRWPGRTALILSALRWAIDRPPMLLTGELDTDMRRGAERARAILQQDMFVAALPTMMQVFIDGQGPAVGLSFDSLFPTRRALVEGYGNRAESQGYRTDIDPEASIDALLGAMLMRLLTTGKPPTREFVDDVTKVILAGTKLDLEA